MSAVVTGGGGYVGSRLCRQLVKEGYDKVTAIDVHFIEDEKEGANKIKGDIRNFDFLNKIVSKLRPDVIFHVASYGMSGLQMFDKKMIESVNIQGTRNVIETCIKNGVESLVYTSTYNVVFCGQKIINGTESLPYYPLDKHVDHYSRTKSIAEQAVLAANGAKLEKEGSVLRTCALRCAGIYGEGEQRHLPRIVDYLEKGLVLFTFGDKDVKTDFLHVDNLVQAHIKAAAALMLPRSIPSGKPYFISDNNPINNFMFLKPLITGLGYSYPTVRLPLWIMYYVAYFIEILHSIISKVYNFKPFMTRAEVYKVGVTHYFSIEQATRDFGYQPEPKTLDGVVKWFKERGHGKKKKEKSHTTLLIVLTIVIIVVASLILIYF
ncbi:PREDICTED: short-chain dehydrogenase/reductase family 42E member 1-like [Amphimedon queenslandica]|uniref:3-beta hydroxysteroid dehydrogenase/isomerase domain-containing protein n=1 Tax=Amphimedon queenslandica TaxID=400682 RepID=A0A1X7V7E9_AMPQE|nr:PREDICTED: short-chain dehydrogenase/reductase family 42E member 1-like [Amphimedon queenslandica]|eukprot:XP_019850393.1 PREDICTED: short-chain dehydrogenase/reductase family 42E member 1-like [Amphimedon queenslandica]